MTRRPRKAKVARKASHKKRKAAKPAKRPQRDPLDDFIVASARVLDLTIDQVWMPAVRGNLAVTLRLAALVSAFTLPDDAEPAPVFKA
jgi:hypothetical protein